LEKRLSGAKKNIKYAKLRVRNEQKKLAHAERLKGVKK